jgi:hypothetical protein
MVINSTGGKFKARYPAEPKKGSRPVGGTTFTTYVVASGGGVCEVAFADVPVPAADEGKLSARLDAARDAAVAAAEGTLANSKQTSSNWEHPGREFTATLADGRHLRGRVYVNGKRVYQMTVTGTGEYTESKDATAFLDSFQITK